VSIEIIYRRFTVGTDVDYLAITRQRFLERNPGLVSINHGRFRCSACRLVIVNITRLSPAVL
jgi:hypothetical protein